jgi:pre-mRNA-splicing factor SYF1
MEAVNNVFERALVFMHKMPVIWHEYCAFLMRQPAVTRTRRTFDRALQSLPITQHDKLWPLYLQFVRAAGVRATCVRVYRRYLQFDPTGREQYVDYLLSIGHYDEAAHQLATLVNDEHFVSREGRTKHSFWMQLCDVVSQHPADITSLQVDPILRSGIGRFTDEVGRLWCALAEYYVRQGLFEIARDVYEEALASVVTVRDFATVFDAYSQFEEAMLTAKMELVEAEGGSIEAASSSSSSSSATNGSAGADGGAGAAAGVVRRAGDLEDLSTLAEAGDDVELRVARLELLMDRRPILLNSVLLRQNPHNVGEWLKRATLHKDTGASAARVVAVYAEAVKTVDPAHAVGKVAALWTAFARYYEDAGDMDNARAVFRRGTCARFRSVEELASLWCEWAEMEIRAHDYERARKLMEEVTTPPRERHTLAGAGGADGGRGSGGDHIHGQVHRSLRLWSLYLDLEESLGSVASTKAAYDRAIALRVATPLMVLNYASYMEEKQYYEDSFRAFEQGVAAFPWPHVKDIWVAYLTKFLERYGGSKLERSRDLFEQAVTGCPPSEAAPLYKLYAEMEETHGMVRHAMAIYDRATDAVADGDKYELYLTYVRKAEEYYGAPRTRDIYAKAVDALPEAQVKDMCLRFAAMETKLGEVDRARAIYTHAANFCDPTVATSFWSAWQDFEVAHGSEDTFREMLRVKRSVAAQFSTANYAVTDMLNSGMKALAAGSAGGLLSAPPAAAGGASAAGGAGAGVGQKRPLAAVSGADTAAAGSRGADGGSEDAAGAGSSRPAKQARLHEHETGEGEAAAASSSSSSAPPDVGVGAGARSAAPSDEEIDLDALGDDAVDVQQRPIPAAVFGGLLPAAQEGGQAGAGAGAAAPMGAMERLRAAGHG